uniref:hypothetical protein n=1 Tax=Psychrobacter sp. DAB_AL43B TaxID=1028416 RepID=UPI000259F7C9|nr:hypothetical protein [Psychrobacter sp. DAB_AL43B]AFH75081.1 hypothetical protein [Psychrobacter sp. DAB_AL43B]
MKISKKLLILFLPIMLLGCDDTSEPHPSGVTSSEGVGGETDTMEECKHRLNETAQKHNVTYTVTIDERDHFSGHIVKDGVQTDLLISCDKKSNYYQGLFQIPD